MSLGDGTLGSGILGNPVTFGVTLPAIETDTGIATGRLKLRTTTIAAETDTAPGSTWRIPGLTPGTIYRATRGRVSRAVQGRIRR